MKMNKSKSPNDLLLNHHSVQTSSVVRHFSLSFRLKTLDLYILLIMLHCTARNCQHLSIGPTILAVSCGPI